MQLNAILNYLLTQNVINVDIDPDVFSFTLDLSEIQILMWLLPWNPGPSGWFLDLKKPNGRYSPMTRSFKRLAFLNDGQQMINICIAISLQIKTKKQSWIWEFIDRFLYQDTLARYQLFIKIYLGVSPVTS